nr:MAG TPA: hypothetical protein [Inoviridae sp.]
MQYCVLMASAWYPMPAGIIPAGPARNSSVKIAWLRLTRFL